MPQHGEVVHGHDRRDASPRRRAEDRAVEHVDVRPRGRAREQGADTRRRRARPRPAGRRRPTRAATTSTSSRASSPRRSPLTQRAVPARVCSSGAMSSPTLIRRPPRTRADGSRRTPPAEPRRMLEPRSSELLAPIERVPDPGRRSPPGRRIDPDGSLVRTPRPSTGATEATTGTPQAIASTIGMPKPSKSDG